jgi:hypothetical protein
VNERAHPLAGKRMRPPRTVCFGWDRERDAGCRHLRDPRIGRKELFLRHEKELRDDLGAEIAARKHPYDRALRHHDGYRPRRAGDGCGRRMARAEPGQEVRRRGDVHVDVAAGGDEDAVVAKHEGAVELSELLHRLAEFRAVDTEKLRRVAVQRVEEQRARLGEHVVDVADDEERADLAALASFAGDLDGELDDLLQRPPARLGAVCAPAHDPEGLVQPFVAPVLAHHLF